MFINILSIDDMELLQILVGNCTVLNKPYVASKEFRNCLCIESFKKFILKSPQIISSMELSFMELRRASNLFKKFSRFPDGNLYMLTIPMVQHDKYNLIAQASKSLTSNQCTVSLHKCTDCW